MTTSKTEQEMVIIWSWFEKWGQHQRAKFVDSLVTKVVPQQVCSLYDAMGSLNIENNSQDVFQCQLRMIDKWFRSWTDTEKNRFVDGLEKRDYETIQYFYVKVAQTAQEP
jgi:hypothetical protein